MKKIIRKIINLVGYEIIKLIYSPYEYYMKPRKIYFCNIMDEVKDYIYKNSPSKMYRESYYIHQIVTWSSVPGIIKIYREININKGMNESRLQCTSALVLRLRGFLAEASRV